MPIARNSGLRPLTSIKPALRKNGT